MLLFQDLPKLTALVKVHQVLRCSVLTKDGDEKKIPLTARTSIINRGLALKHLYEGMTLSACVVSKEDHG